MQLPPGIRRICLDSAGSFPALEIETTACRALIAIQGAQLLRMQPVGRAPLLWLSPGAQFVPGRAVRGGIPLCFPWFGAHPDNPALPAHGFARNRDWRLVSASCREDDEGAARLAFELQDDESTFAMWPHSFLARIEYVLGSSITMTFSVTNTGSKEASFGFALHSYFPVSDISHMRIEGLEGVSFVDKLASDTYLKSEQSPIRVAAETDRIYVEAPGEYRLVDEQSGVTLAISAPECRSAVVWNPWQEKAARLGDVPGTSWREMLCVECGNVGALDVRLRAGETRAFRQLIRQLP